MKNLTTYLSIFILLLALGACGGDSATGPDPEPEPEPEPNQAPQSFTVTGTPQDNTILLNWTPAEDPDGDAVSYSVFLEGQQVFTAIADTFATLDELEFDTSFSGRVVASDGNGGESEAPFETVTQPEAPQPIFSDFEVSNEGWGTYSDARGDSVRYFSEDGNPGGYINIVDASQSGVFGFTAPDKFSGDLRGFYLGTLSYDLFVNTTEGIAAAGSSQSRSEIRIENSEIDRLIFLPFNEDRRPTTAWANYSIQLDASLGLWTFSGSGSPATEEDFEAVLQNVTEIRIRGEYSSTFFDEGNLDNVILRAAEQ